MLGNRGDLDLRPEVEKLLHAGLLEAANTGTAWFITNGYSTGVSRFIGQALRGNEANAPIIGVSQWDMLDQTPWKEGMLIYDL